MQRFDPSRSAKPEAKRRIKTGTLIEAAPEEQPSMIDLQGMDPVIVQQMMDQESGMRQLKAQQHLSQYDGPRDIMQDKDEKLQTVKFVETSQSSEPRAIHAQKLLDWDAWRTAYRQANCEANAMRAMINQNRQQGKPVYMNYIDKTGQVNRSAEITIDTHDPAKFAVTYRGKDSHGQVRTITTGGVDFQSIKPGPTSTPCAQPQGWKPQPAPERDPQGFFRVGEASYESYGPSRNVLQRAKAEHRKSQREVRQILKKQTGRQVVPSIDTAPDGTPVHEDLDDVRAKQNAEQIARSLMSQAALCPLEDDIEISLRQIMPDATHHEVPYVHHEEVVVQDMP